ncbi:hypothetical protein FRC17_011129 [Serendipita sp. 399]|nr:hypothetical protein FRC17_011129 [Serendipita sp. 399]
MANPQSLNFTIDDTSPIIRYTPNPTFAPNVFPDPATNWSPICDRIDAAERCDDHSAHVTGMEGAKLAFSFFGTGINLFGNVTLETTFSLTIDENTVSNGLSGNEGAESQILAKVSGLSPAVHTLILTVKKGTDLRGLFTFDYAQVLIGNVTESWNTYKGYNASVPDGVNFSTFRATDIMGANVNASFRGSTLFYYGPCYTASGAYTIALDAGANSQPLLLNASVPFTQAIARCLRYYTGGLGSQSRHEILITNNEDRKWLTLHWLEIWDFELVASPGAGGGGAPSSAIMRIPNQDSGLFGGISSLFALIMPDPRLNELPHVPRPNPWVFSKSIGPPIQNAPNKRRFLTQYDSHPLDIFTPAVHSGTVPAARWIYTDNEAKPSVLIFTDGASPGNGQPGARAGFGIVFSPLYPGLSSPLERSPLGYEPTSNRAELRAAIGALTMRYWPGEGFFRLVIGTDSEYVVNGASQWCLKWKANGWKTASGNSVKNQDLWMILLNKIEEFEANGFSVQFFQLKREWNQEADAAARLGATKTDIPEDYSLDGAKFAISFFGVGIHLFGNVTSGVTYELNIDGNGVSNGANAEPQVLAKVSNLTPAVHTLTLTVKKGEGGGLFTFDYAQVIIGNATSFERTILDGISSPNLTYGPDEPRYLDSWKPYGAYNATVSEGVDEKTFKASDLLGANVHTNFSGSTILYYGPCYAASGAYTIALDETSNSQPIQFNASVPFTPVIARCLRYYASGLSTQAGHKLLITNSQEGSWMMVHWLEVWNFELLGGSTQS